jgi:integrase
LTNGPSSSKHPDGLNGRDTARSIHPRSTTSGLGLLTRAGLRRGPGGGLPERTPHALRHTYASLHIAKAIEAGRDRDAILTYLRNQLRHRNIQTTMEYYIHLFPGGQREIVNRLDDDTAQDWTPVFRPTRTGNAARLDAAQTVVKTSH